MNLRKLVARCKAEVGQKFIDFFCIGHMLLGFITFGIIAFLLFWMPSFTISKLIALSMAFYILLGWEMFENLTPFGMKLKYIKGIRDSLANALSDIMFGVIGAVLGYFLFFDPFGWYFIVLANLVLLIIIGRYINF